jgi:hypothetical protein
MAACARHLVALGRYGLVVYVLKANPYRKFYEALGGALSGENQVEMGEVTLPEVVYRWNDVRTAGWLDEEPTQDLAD